MCVIVCEFNNNMLLSGANGVWIHCVIKYYRRHTRIHALHASAADSECSLCSGASIFRWTMCRRCNMEEVEQCIFAASVAQYAHWKGHGALVLISRLFHAWMRSCVVFFLSVRLFQCNADKSILFVYSLWFSCVPSMRYSPDSQRSC